MTLREKNERKSVRGMEGGRVEGREGRRKEGRREGWMTPKKLVNKGKRSDDGCKKLRDSRERKTKVIYFKVQ